MKVKQQNARFCSRSSSARFNYRLAVMAGTRLFSEFQIIDATPLALVHFWIVAKLSIVPIDETTTALANYEGRAM